MSTTDSLSALLDRVNAATLELQRSAVVPPSVAALVDDFDPVLQASTPLRLQLDPYLSTQLFAAAFRAEKALRHDALDVQRRDLRIALEQFRHALRDIVERRPYAIDTPVRDVLARTVETVPVPQKDLAELLGVSTRQLQRWLSPDGPVPAGDDEARVRVVAQLVSQLRHSFTGPGVLAWFHRPHPQAGEAPLAWLKDPLRYPQLLDLATSARATAA